MAMTVGVRFSPNGKIYDFNPGDLTFLPGELVVVETARGVECGEVARANRNDPNAREDMKPILRRANEDDRRRAEENRKKARDAMRICQERIAAHNLEMKLVDAEYAFDNSKITFNFTAEGRVDFRSLVKDLAAALHTRIELHQIGVRDEAKKLGGIGICGQPFCCSRFLKEFQPVSIKMAKEQGLSLNPTKISGSCGRLMCCLKYEQDVYEELVKLSPKVGATVMTPEGRGVVTDSNILTGKVKVRLDRSPDSPAVEMTRDDLAAVVRDSRPADKPEEKQPEKKPEPAAAEKPRQERPQPEKTGHPADKNGQRADHRPRRHRPRNKRQG